MYYDMKCISLLQYIKYNVDDEHVENFVWPKHQSISSFMDGSGEALLRQAVSDMFGDIREILTDLTKSLLERVNDVTENMGAINDYLEAFQTKLVLDDKFVRYVFVNVHQYNERLKLFLSLNA